MSTQNITLNNGQQATINTDVSKIFLWENRYEMAPYNNSSYASVTLPAGTLMGRVAGTGYIKPVASGASDGSQYPIGILADDFIVEAGDLLDLPICIYGDVAIDKVVFQGSDNMDVTVSPRRLRDWITLVGIRLISSTEMTKFDN